MPAPKTSPRPKERPSAATMNAQKGPVTQEDKAKNPVKSATTTGAVKTPTAPAAPGGVVIPNPPATPPRAPNQPAPSNPAQLPADKVEAERGVKRPDRTLLDALNQPTASRDAKKYKGGVLASVYNLPVDGTKSAKTLQQFNGPRGSRMTLGA